MKRIYYFIGYIVILFVVLNITSCSKNDDESSNSNTPMYVTIGNNTSTFNHSYWSCWANEGTATGENDYHIMFFDCDLLKPMPALFSGIDISISAPGNSNELAVGTYAPSKYRVIVELNVSTNSDRSKEIDYESNNDSGDGNLVITKNGDGYSVTLSKVTLYDSAKNAESTSFTYNGGFTYVNPKN